MILIVWWLGFGGINCFQLQGRNEPNFENGRLYRSEEVMNGGGYETVKHI
jgi:hypothetical protein